MSDLRSQCSPNPLETLDATASRSHPLTVRPERSCAPTRVFEDDELVSFRYRIRGLLGRGGMGEVYEAEDLELRERVALKVLRRELAERPEALELLKREIALARKVSHPNVCRLFDVGFHLRSGASGSERICFLTMELLRGEPLSALLRRNGRLSHNEALPVARQLAEGLGAAHQAGIIHRDLKSANVLLVPSPTGGAPRAVISDFGLARAAGESSTEPTGTGSRVAGTPAYMAPEQLEGGPITPSTDLYALGIILFELLTGVRPFQGDEAWSTATQRLHAPAPSPRKVRPELAPQWEALILRCLERKPQRRFQSTRELLATLPAPQREVPASQSSRSRSRAFLTLLTLGVHILLAGAHTQPLPPGPLMERPKSARRSVAVLGFAAPSVSPETAWLSSTLSQALRLGLHTTTQELGFFSESLLGTAKTALALEDVTPLPPEALARLRGLLGCDFVVQGSYSVTKLSGTSSLRLKLDIQDAATGTTVAVLEEHGPLEDLLLLVSRLGERLFQALGVQGEPLFPRLKHVLPSSIEALRLFAEGSEKIRQREGAAAQVHFEQALALEPGASGVHSSLAYALIIKGERGRAREHLQRALLHPEQLSTVQRLSLEALYQGYAPDWKRAAELHQQIVELAPDDPQSGINLASAQIQARNPEGALATLAKIREYAPPIFAPQLDTHEAKAALATSDFPRAQAAAARAVAGAEALKDELSAATSRSLEADAWYLQGTRDRALEALRDAIKRFQRAGSRVAEADATSKLAEMLPAQDLRGRLQASRAAMALYQEVGSQLGTCMTLLSIADYEHGLGEIRGALRSAEASVPLCRETRLPSLEMNSLSLVGRVHRSLGNLDAAEASFRGQLRLAQEHESKAQIATGLTDLADLSQARGDLVRARQLYTEAQEFLRGNKRRELEKDLGLNLRLARLSMEEGRLAEAEQLADGAVTAVQELTLPTVHLLRARIFLAQGQYKEASAALLEAGEPPLLQTRLGLRIQRARLSTARGSALERKAAREELHAILAEARRLEWREGQFEALMALGEVELASGLKADGMSRLRALEREAKKTGWGLWVRRASAVPAPPQLLPQGALSRL
jgi:serine/threonine protein kinase/tetratricopeptide (TPR) repeat protein